LGHRPGALHGRGALGGVPAGRACRRQRLLLRDLRGGLRLQRGDGGDHRHDRDPRDGATRLRPPPHLRLAGRGRDAGDPHPALGSTVSLVLAALARGLTWRALNRAFQETVRTTSMVVLIIIFASIFSHVMALIGAPSALFATVVGLGLPRWALFTLIFAFLLLIAYALEELSVMIIILPILFPLVT